MEVVPVFIAVLVFLLFSSEKRHCPLDFVFCILEEKYRDRICISNQAHSIMPWY